MSPNTQPTVSCGLCPTCHGAMEWRQNRRSGTWFQGCTQWPNCTGTRDVHGVSSVISSQRQNRMWAVIKAAVLRSEDECLTFTEEDLHAAEDYELHLDEFPDEKCYVVTVKRKP